VPQGGGDDDFLASVTEPGKPDHLLTLKPGCLVTCTRNLGRSAGVSNGSRLCVVAIRRHVVMCRKLYGDQGSPTATVAIPRLLFDIAVPKSLMVVKRRQFPLRLGYANTGHRVQGMTLPDRTGLDLRRPAFAHGQLYVIFSRGPRMENVGLLVNPEDVVDTPHGPALLLTNIVYPELLEGALEPSAFVPHEPPVAYHPEVDPRDAEDVALMEAWMGVTGGRRAPRSRRGPTGDRADGDPDDGGSDDDNLYESPCVAGVDWEEQEEEPDGAVSAQPVQVSGSLPQAASNGECGPPAPPSEWWHMDDVDIDGLEFPPVSWQPEPGPGPGH
jgi:hypothetical protein